MTNPVTPPPELVKQWEIDATLNRRAASLWTTAFAAEAAQWGADTELEACCQALYSRYVNTGLLPATAETVSQEMRDWLRAARRPKPPSLKERSLQLLETYNTSGVMLTADQVDTIKRALEALDA
jgi:hypothetical protein